MELNIRTYYDINFNCKIIWEYNIAVTPSYAELPGSVIFFSVYFKCKIYILFNPALSGDYDTLKRFQ